MPQASGDTRQFFPNLSKLGIAIVEHLVEKTIGDAFVEEIKDLTLRSKLKIRWAGSPTRGSGLH
jgi:hypothetical protein